MEGVGDADEPIDDELQEYISDDDSTFEDWDEEIEIKPGDRPNVPPPNELSEDSKALLFWRHQEGKRLLSVIDWKMKLKIQMMMMMIAERKMCPSIDAGDGA